MHDLKAIRDDPSAFDEGLRRRGLPPQAAAILALDQERRRLQQGLEEMQARRNSLSKEIGRLKAKGEADSQYARAEGLARAQLTQARAEAEATKLRGEADATATRAKIEAAGGVDGYTRQLQAQAALNWKGNLPQILGASGTQFPIILPLQLDEKK